MSKSTQNTPY